ncbi:MAG: sigma-70 family RNA polymerase sigma factor [Planctomycetes bacterium]|nr:sigma-70 family RNA polymerase sigma factor [Planctomycetota bacterium]
MIQAESDLILRCARGDEAAYRELVERLEKPLINFVHRYVGDRSLAEDIFQETFVRVIRTLGDFRPEASLTTWIFTIARNLCLDHLKAKKRHREVSLDARSEDDHGNVIDFRDALSSPGHRPEGEASDREQERRLREAIGRLAGPKREALILRVFSGLPYEDIARITHAPVGTVKFRVHDAVRELARWLSEGSAEEAAG